MEDNEWKAKRYDDLLRIAGDQLERKITGYDLLAVEAAALRWKAERYDELMRLAGERALSRIRNFESLVAQVKEHQQKQLEYEKMIEAQFPRIFVRLRIYETKINRRLARYERMHARMQTLEWKAARYDELITLGGERIAAKLEHYDELLAQQNAKNWKVRRYDNLTALGGERTAAKLRAYDGLLADNKRLSSELRKATLQLGGAEGEGRPDADYKIIMVLGAARTGTTMIGSYFAWAPECHGLTPEAAPLFAAMRNHANLMGASERFMGVENKLAADAATQSYLRLFCDSYQAQQKTPAIVFRSPALTRYFNVLHELLDFATIRYVVCVRDPRDACVSLLDWNARMVEQGRKPVLDAPTAEAAAELYMGYYKNVLSLREIVDPMQLTFVRYEDAVRDPINTAARLGAFAGVDLSDFDPEAPWPDKSHDFQAEKETNLAVTPLYGRPPSESQIGRYQDRLSPDEIARIEETCEPIIRAFRYDSRLADALP